jgi:hypothetical protein
MIARYSAGKSYSHNVGALAHIVSRNSAWHDSIEMVGAASSAHIRLSRKYNTTAYVILSDSYSYAFGSYGDLDIHPFYIITRHSSPGSSAVSGIGAYHIDSGLEDSLLLVESRELGFS